MTVWQGQGEQKDGQRAGDRRCGGAGGRRGENAVGTLGMRKLKGAAADKSINMVMGTLWTGSMVWCPETRGVMGWPLPV